jgi:low temperature requirement protein LtrA
MTELAAATSHAPDLVEWLAPFFDLVVVAAVAVLCETLREDATHPGHAGPPEQGDSRPVT